MDRGLVQMRVGKTWQLTHVAPSLAASSASTLNEGATAVSPIPMCQPHCVKRLIKSPARVQDDMAVSSCTNRHRASPVI